MVQFHQGETDNFQVLSVGLRRMAALLKVAVREADPATDGELQATLRKGTQLSVVPPVMKGIQWKDSDMLAGQARPGKAFNSNEDEKWKETAAEHRSLH